MEENDSAQSRERVKILAAAVSLPVDDDRIPALAQAFDAALELLEGVESLADTGGIRIGEPYDPAWREEGVRS